MENMRQGDCYHCGDAWTLVKRLDVENTMPPKQSTMSVCSQEWRVKPTNSDNVGNLIQPRLEWYKRESAEDQLVPLGDRSSSAATCQTRSPTRPRERHQTPARSGAPDQCGGNQIEHCNHQERRNKVALLRLVQVQGVATGNILSGYIEGDRLVVVRSCERKRNEEKILNRLYQIEKSRRQRSMINTVLSWRSCRPYSRRNNLMVKKKDDGSSKTGAQDSHAFFKSVRMRLSVPGRPGSMRPPQPEIVT
ncbi:uncharacterized protein LOC104869642 [Fukomys damarensis]|uniref:uncharacterized protein LOC104869642 n=1 Tax=Fukomys damarensis TaxID=885580 RepID=UPI0014559127|nr:uncharacterized protein LOC104869642 [Fukomys damarensis]